MEVEQDPDRAPAHSDIDTLASASATMDRIPSETESDEDTESNLIDVHGNVIYKKIPEPNYPPLHPEHFSSDDSAGIAEHMEEYGFVVVKDVIDPSRVKKLFLNDMEEVNPDLHKKTKGSKVESILWSMEESIDYPRPNMPGLGGEWGLCHGRAAWATRTAPKVKGVFQDLLHSRDIVCSMDCISFTSDKEFLESPRGWLHVDQIRGIDGSDLQSLQGIVYCEDTSEDPKCATTAVVPGSHHEWASHKFTSATHFQILRNQHRYFPRARRLMIKAGSMLVFNSRLAHQGWCGRHRLAFMVSYGLKADRAESVRERKIRMYLSGARSSHWSQLGLLHGYKFSDSGALADNVRTKRSRWGGQIIDYVASLTTSTAGADNGDAADAASSADTDTRFHDQPDVPGCRWRLLQTALVNTDDASDDVREGVQRLRRNEAWEAAEAPHLPGYDHLVPPDILALL
eukprot:m.9228 g.9228  ORF g.9228 m.9228 type:complete len:457 (+) comp6859_c0_seq1:319-1689(+)